MKTIAIGVDVGGSHVSCMAYNLVSKSLLPETFAESDLDNHGQPEEIISAWGKTIAESLEKVGLANVAGIGFAMPGPFNYVEGIPLFSGENAKYENIRGVNVPEELRKYLDIPEVINIRFINDATAFAIGEDQLGKAKDFACSLSVTLGTGFGSAFVKNDMPVVDGDHVPENGCLWHLPFEDGIADDYFSTRGLINRYEKATGEKVQSVKKIADLAANLSVAQDLFNDFGKKMGMFLQPWIKKSGIEIFVMGGNISRAYHLYGESLHQYFADVNIKIKVAISELRENASFIGSATLLDDTFYEKVLPVLKKM
jgi:glucokinase